MFRYSNSSRTKRRRVIPLRPTREVTPEPTPPVFQNIRIYIHPNNINNSRRKVLQNLIEKNSGSFAEEPDGEMTHVLVDENVSSGRLCRSLGWTTFPPNVNVLMVSWLSASVRAGRCLNPVDYEIPCTHRPVFATSPRLVTFENCTATGPTNDNVNAEASTSVPSEDDADVEFLNFEYVYEEGSTYDDGKYDEETSCDDEWVQSSPIIPSHTIGTNSSNPNPCGTFPTNSFSSESNFGSLLPTPDCKKQKLNNTPPLPRPNTLAARLSRVRVRRVPEHLRVPGGSSIIVDLNGDLPDESCSKTDEDKTINQNDINTVLNGIQTSSTDENCKRVRMQCRPYQKSKTKNETHKKEQSTESGAEASEDKGNRSENALSLEKQIDVESSSEVSQVLTQIVDSVLEVAVNAKIIKESVEEISKNAMEDDHCASDPFKNESIRDELVKDVLIRVVDDVVREEAESKIEIVKVESMVTNCKGISVNFDQGDSVEIEKKSVRDESKANALGAETQITQLPENEPMEVSQVIGAETKKTRQPENEPMEVSQALGDETQITRQPENQPMEVSQDNRSFESFREDYRPPPRIRQLCLVLPPNWGRPNPVRPPYPVRLFRSSGGNQTRSNPVECITAEIGHSSNSESLGNEIASDSNAVIAPISEVVAPVSEVVAPVSEVAAPVSEVAAPVSEVAAPVSEVAALVSEVIAPIGKVIAPIGEVIAPIGEVIAPIGEVIAPIGEVIAPISAVIASSESGVDNQTRSCGRPDISGPNIFFPFPNPSTSASSSTTPNSHSSNDQRSTSALIGSCPGPNDEIIKKLRLLFESFKNTGEKWRIDVYEKAISLFAKYQKPVESLEEIQSLNGISKKIAQKIWEIAQTGNLKDLDDFCTRRSEETRKLFSRAWGISPNMARKLWKEGNSSLKDLMISTSLSRSHLVGLRYYEDLKTKMSKKEASRIFLTVLKVIFAENPEVQGDACSSLRRNKKNCGHVSMLLSLPKKTTINDHRLLPNIVAKLHHLGYLTDDLIRHEENGNQTKYVGIFKLGASCKHRRIDITVCTQEEYACALLFLTGSSYFNRAIQQWALKREMVLDEHSLRMRVLNTSGGTDSVTRLHTPDERTIFTFLDLPYRTPEQRDRFVM